MNVTSNPTPAGNTKAPGPPSTALLEAPAPGPWPSTRAPATGDSGAPPRRRTTTGELATQIADLARSVEELKAVVSILDGRERANQERLTADLDTVKAQVQTLQSSQSDLREQLLAEVGGHIKEVFGFLNKIVQEGETTRLMTGKKFQDLGTELSEIKSRMSPWNILKTISPLLVLAIIQLIMGAIQKGH